MAEQLIRKTVAALEGEQLAVCPECGVQMPGRQRPEHLVQAHGYVQVSNLLIPRPEALAYLWERVFVVGDAEAHDRLAKLLAEETVEGAEAAYRTALETELLRRADTLFAARWQELPRLVRCLRPSATARPHFRGLLRANDPRVREVGRELLLPDACKQLAPAGTTAEDVRRWLDRLCPLEGVEDKIRLCPRLTQFGADPTAVASCLEELQSERPVACPECRQPVPRSGLDDHLRQAHHIHQFRGARYPAGEIAAVLAAAVCSPEPDMEAWQELVELARDEYRRQAEAFLADTLSQTLRGVAAEQRTETITAVAQTLATRGCKPRLVVLLAANPETAGRHLALALGARLPAPLDDTLIAALRPLLLDTRLPEGAHLAAAAALLRTTGPSGPVAKEVLGAFTAGLGKSRAVERLARLRPLAGKCTALDELSTRLEDRIRMRCPRCPTELRRRDMVPHLWQEHRLVLDGRRVREPEQVIEDWVADYRQAPDTELLERCRILGQRLDPRQGLTRVQRLFLIAGIDDPEARRTLLAGAEQQHGSLCPHCYALVPIPKVVPPAAVSLCRGRLSARGYRVEIVQTGLRPWLEIETPGETTYGIRQPGRPLTFKGATFLFAGPYVAAALLLAFLLPLLGVRPLLPVLLILAMASLIYLLIQYLWREPTPLPDQAVNYAWKLLVPNLHPSSFSLEDSAFVAGLALASLTHGRPKTRSKQLERALNLTENAAADGAAHHLSALHRLAIADAARAGANPVPLVVAQVGRCFDGKLPLVFAEELLADWDADYWNPDNRARLRVALCDRAFEAGFEVRNLIEAARSAPALGEVLLKDETSALAWLRLLWSLRARRPWDQCGAARTAFELAADPGGGGKLLARYPDLLLLQEMELSPGSAEEPPVTAQILLCGRGVVFQEQLFSSAPRSLEVLEKRANGRDGFELLVNERRFWFASDPEDVVPRLERWCRFYFGELLPQAGGVYDWQSPSVASTLRAHDMVRCPECRRTLLTRVGEEGVAIEAGPAGTDHSPVESLRVD